MGINYWVSTSVALCPTKRIERPMFIRILDVYQVARCALAVGAAAVAVSGCNSAAGPQSPPPTEVSVMEVKTGPVTVYNEYVAQAQANLVNAQQNLARNSRLIAQKAVSQQDYDTAVAQERASAALVEAQRALLRNVELNLEFATIRAPRDGFMSSSQVKPGALITAQQTLLSTLYSSDPMWVYFSISEDRLLELQKADRTPDKTTPFHIKLADGSDYAMTGRLDFVDAVIDQRTGTLQVRITVPNPERALRPGLFVRVSVPVLDAPEAICIPQQAVQELQGTK